LSRPKGSGKTLILPGLDILQFGFLSRKQKGFPIF
jgi:hypothetical protein